jgi:hypothetical protein
MALDLYNFDSVLDFTVFIKVPDYELPVFVAPIDKQRHFRRKHCEHLFVIFSMKVVREFEKWVSFKRFPSKLSFFLS